MKTLNMGRYSSQKTAAPPGWSRGHGVATGCGGGGGGGMGLEGGVGGAADGALQHDTVAGCHAPPTRRQAAVPGHGRRVPTGHYPPSLREALMKIHEYQGKDILRQFGVPVPRGIPAFTVQEAVEAAQKLGGPVWVVKAQIHAGGRGKGGGVQLAKTIDEVRRLAGSMLGMQLKTHQTGPEGQKVRRLYIEQGPHIA